MEYSDYQYRYNEDEILYCKNKLDKDNKCTNCKDNIHLNCDNYNPRKDYCLKYFQDNISTMKECQEKTVYNDKELSKKWSN